MTLRQTLQAAPTKSKELIEKLKGTSNQAVKTRESVFAELKEQLTLYLDQEEQHLLPILRKHAETKALAADAAKAGKELRTRLTALDGAAKDNNASCAIGPFIRLFDDAFTMNDVRSATVELVVEGGDGYRLEGSNEMSEISRDPEELVRQAMSEHHFPDGFTLFLGTLFAPVQDRDVPGRGFTHKVGDVVRISTPRIGALVNRVATSRDAPPWTFGVSALIRNLAARGIA